ncbi:MAG: hypothetical protein MHM6MM_002993 [Cercozoa sp. M6MM]
MGQQKSRPLRGDETVRPFSPLASPSVSAPVASSPECQDAGAPDSPDVDWFQAQRKFVQARQLPTMANTRRSRLQQQTLRDVTRIGFDRSSVRLPKDVDPSDEQRVNEWLAMHVVHCFNAASLVFAAADDFCGVASCPVMSAGKKFTFKWATPGKREAPRDVPAREYAKLLFSWCDSLLADAAVFVPENGRFPSNFRSTVDAICRRLFRIYAHVYHSHFTDILGDDEVV